MMPTTKFTVALLMLVGASVAVAQNTKKVAAKPVVKKISQPAAPAPLQMKIKLHRDMVLEGTPVELDTISMNTVYGEAKIALHTIAGIRFPNEKEQATLIFRNGDSLTGGLSLDQIKFVSQWGEATINTASIESVVFVDGMSWSSGTNSLGNSRWTLSRASMPTTVQNYQLDRQVSPATYTGQ